MPRIRIWMTFAAILLLAAGGSVGYLVATHIDPPNAAADVGSPPDGYWQDWLVGSEGLWDELGLDTERRDAWRRELEKRRRHDAELRQQIDDLASDTRELFLASLTRQQRDKANATLALYSERRFDSEARRELERLRDELKLRDAQLPSVYRTVYDTRRERHELWEKGRKGWEGGKRPTKEDWERARKAMEAIYTRREARMQEILDDEQFAAYRELVEKRRHYGRGGPRGPGGSKRGPSGKRGPHGEGEGEKARDDKGCDAPGAEGKAEAGIPAAPPSGTDKAGSEQPLDNDKTVPDSKKRADAESKAGADDARRPGRRRAKARAPARVVWALRPGPRVM